jgi:hypothetical protein
MYWSVAAGPQGPFGPQGPGGPAGVPGIAGPQGPPAYAFSDVASKRFVKTPLQVDADKVYLPGAVSQERLLASMTDSSGCTNIQGSW